MTDLVATWRFLLLLARAPTSFATDCWKSWCFFGFCTQATETLSSKSEPDSPCRCLYGVNCLRLGPEIARHDR